MIETSVASESPVLGGGSPPPRSRPSSTGDFDFLRVRSVADHMPHKHAVGGSIPPPATNFHTVDRHGRPVGDKPSRVSIPNGYGVASLGGRSGCKSQLGSRPCGVTVAPLKRPRRYGAVSHPAGTLPPMGEITAQNGIVSSGDALTVEQPETALPGAATETKRVIPHAIAVAEQGSQSSARSNRASAANFQAQPASSGGVPGRSTDGPRGGSRREANRLCLNIARSAALATRGTHIKDRV